MTRRYDRGFRNKVSEFANTYPACHSTEIDGDGVEFYEEFIFASAHCNDCGIYFEQEYVFNKAYEENE